MFKVRTLTAAVIVTVCAGCATLDESACRAGNWRQLGYVDGLKGYASPRIAEHQKACAEYGIAPDTTAWQLGYIEGQAQYCTVPNGYIQGRDGQSYADVCPPELDAKFRPAFQDGKRVAAILDRMDSIDRELRGIASRLEEDDRRAAEYLDAVRGGHKPVRQPELIGRDERRNLERDFSTLNADYAAARHELERRDADYSAQYGVVPLEPALRN